MFSQIFHQKIIPSESSHFSKVTEWSGNSHHPVFLTRMRDGEFELLNKLNIDLANILHASQEYEFTGEIQNEISFKTELKEDFEKKGSHADLRFLIFETRFFMDESNPVATSKTTFVIKKNHAIAQR